MKKIRLIYSMNLLLLSVFIILCTSCRSVEGISHANEHDLNSEGSAVFVRPQDYTIFFGTRSLSNYLEITYNNKHFNQADQMVVDLGIRYKGPARWYNFMKTAPEKIVIMGQANFYQTSQQGHGPSSPPVYRTNKQKFVIKLGDTVDCKFVCPVKDARSYQVVLSEVSPLQ